MKFIFDGNYTKAMEEMENESEEREMHLNPSDVNTPKFITFTSGFMFSTCKQLSVLNEINGKLDTVIAESEANKARIVTIESEVDTLKSDLQAAIDFKDNEIRDLSGKLTVSNQRIDQLDLKINTLTSKQGKDLCVLTKICDKLSAETLTLERYTRSYNFRLFNVPEVAGESAKDVMEKVNTLIHQVTGVDLKVEFGHRTGSKRDDDRPRPVICRIASRSQKMEMMSKRGEFFKKGFPSMMISLLLIFWKRRSTPQL